MKITKDCEKCKKEYSYNVNNPKYKDICQKCYSKVKMNKKQKSLLILYFVIVGIPFILAILGLLFCKFGG